MCKKFENGAYVNYTCAESVRKDPDITCNCRVPISLNKDFEGEVFFYYGLTNFYQNHRRYVKSRDDNQLLGNFNKDDKLTDCEPFDRNRGNGQVIVPCGAIANSLFNDTLKLESRSFGAIPVKNTGIAWASDKEIKFRNPPGDLKEGKCFKF